MLIFLVREGFGNKLYVLFQMVHALLKLKPGETIHYLYTKSHHKNDTEDLFQKFFPALMTKFDKLSWTAFDGLKTQSNFVEVNPNPEYFKQILANQPFLEKPFLEKRLAQKNQHQNNEKIYLLKSYFLDYDYFDSKEQMKLVFKILQTTYNKNLVAQTNKYLKNNNFKENYVLVHIRQGDYAKHSQLFYIFPPEYYINILNKKFYLNKEIIFITDTAQDFIEKQIIPNLKTTSRILISNNSLDIDFTLGLMAQTLVMSPSTMSFSMAYLNWNPKLYIEAPERYVKTNDFTQTFDYKYFGKRISINSILT
jgi:hypothetical protein